MAGPSEPDPIKKLSLIELSEAKGLPALTKAFGEMLAEAGAVCLQRNGHRRGVELRVVGEFDERFGVTWPTVTDKMRRCYNDLEVATEHGAYGVSFLLLLNLTDFTVIEKSRKGTGFDYWLGNDDNLFQRKARLEVSGILRGDDKEIKRRMVMKTRQTARSDGVLPAYVVIVEFSYPKSSIVVKT